MNIDSIACTCVYESGVSTYKPSVIVNLELTNSTENKHN